jgi:hypothetical protein
LIARGGRICFAYTSGALLSNTSLIFDLLDIGRRADVFVDMIEICLRRIEMPRVCLPYEFLDCMHRWKRYTTVLSVIYRCFNNAIKISFSGIIIAQE